MLPYACKSFSSLSLDGQVHYVVDGGGETEYNGEGILLRVFHF
jgi:hypothetical protein